MPEPIRSGAPPRQHGAIVYQLRRSLAELPEGLRLRNHEWGVLFAVTGEHSCAQIGGLLGLSPEDRDRVFGRLLAFGLIEERPLSYGEYLRAVASWRDEEPKSLAAFLRGGQAMADGRTAPRAAAPPAGAPAAATPRLATAPGVIAPAIPPVARAVVAAPPVEKADSDINITRALPTYGREQVTRAGEPRPEVPFLPLEPVAPAPRPAAAPERAAEGRRALSLKALMQYILGKAGDLHAGQLDIYRVFIRIDTKLMQKNGITTLRFEDDRLVEDPELLKAIVASVEKALGFPCPPEVFV